MLAITGFAMVASFMLLIMLRKTSAVVALTLVPILFGAFAGFGPELGKMIATGITQVAPIGITLMFAVLYFGLMLDVGLFDPLSRAIVRRVGDDPLRIALGTTALSLLVALDGDGTSTALVVFGAFVPIYRRISMNPLILLTLLGLTNSLMNLTPWGGPVARVSSALRIDPNSVFLPLLPAMGIAAAGIFVLAWHFGKRERKRLGYVSGAAAASATLPEPEVPFTGGTLRRVANVVLTLALLACVFTSVVPLSVTFMVGAAIALLLNFRTPKEQLARLEAHAHNCFFIILLILCAGAFTGILNGTGMVDAMGLSMIEVIPSQAGPYMAVITAVLSMPMTFLLSNDAYYFGIVPILAKTGAAYGVPAVEIARASLLGSAVHTLSPLMASLYLVTAMLNQEIGPVQRFAMKWAISCSLLLIAGAVFTGALSLPG